MNCSSPLSQLSHLVGIEYSCHHFLYHPFYMSSFMFDGPRRAFRVAGLREWWLDGLVYRCYRYYCPSGFQGCSSAGAVLRCGANEECTGQSVHPWILISEDSWQGSRGRNFIFGTVKNAAWITVLPFTCSRFYKSTMQVPGGIRADIESSPRWSYIFGMCWIPPLWWGCWLAPLRWLQ